MGRRVVVTEPPRDGPRKVAVVREGPPQVDRRRITDIVVGVLGAVLLVLAIVLVPILPQDDPVPPQFEVSFEMMITDDATVQEAVVSEGGSATFPFTYDGERLYRIEVAIEWSDDVVSSLPDSFQVRLLDPAGEVAFGPENFTNPNPESDGNAVLPTYTARPASRVIPADLAMRPTTQVVTGETVDDDLASVTRRVEEMTKTGGGGQWTLEVTLQDAGDCPGPETLDLNRFATCQQETGGGGTDDGNPFQVVRVSFTEYVPVVRPLEQ